MLSRQWGQMVRMVRPAEAGMGLQSDDAASFARWSSPAQAVLGEQGNGTIERSALLRSGFVLLEHALNEAIKSWHAEPDGPQPPSAAQLLQH